MDERANPFVGDQRTFAKKEKDIKERNAQVPVVWRSCDAQRRPCDTQRAIKTRLPPTAGEVAAARLRAAADGQRRQRDVVSTQSTPVSTQSTPVSTQRQRMVNADNEMWCAATWPNPNRFCHVSNSCQCNVPRVRQLSVNFTTTAQERQRAEFRLTVHCRTCCRGTVAPTAAVDG